MLSHAVEPILGIAVVGLAAMHDAVNITTIHVVDVLGDGMRFIEVIVPQKKKRPDRIAAMIGKVLCTDDVFDFGNGFGIITAIRAE